MVGKTADVTVVTRVGSKAASWDPSMVVTSADAMAAK